MLSGKFPVNGTLRPAGTSGKALRNLETGRGSTVETLMWVLKALEYLQGVDMLAPKISELPPINSLPRVTYN